MSPTHICIKDPQCTLVPYVEHKVKKGDCVTLKLCAPKRSLLTGQGYVFHEDPKIIYDTSLFLPLPEQKEKTVYVAVTEKIKKEIEEPVLN